MEPKPHDVSSAELYFSIEWRTANGIYRKRPPRGDLQSLSDCKSTIRLIFMLCIITTICNTISFSFNPSYSKITIFKFYGITL